MSEKWEIDEYWQVTNGKSLFKINDVLLLARTEIAGEYFIDVIFTGLQHKVSFKDQESRDGVWDFLINAKTTYLASSRKHQEQQTALSQSSVLIQGKIAEHVTNHGH